MTIYKNLHPLDAIHILDDLIKNFCKVNFSNVIDLEISFITKPKKF